MKIIKINKNILVCFGVLGTLIAIYGIKRYNKKNILNKFFDFKKYFSIISLYKKRKELKLPVIYKNIKIDLTDGEIEEKFMRTCVAVKLYKNKFSNTDWLFLYGLYKQSMFGNIENNNENENINDFVEYHKMKAWKHCYGLNPKLSKYLYINYFNQLFPNVIENEMINDSIQDNLNISKTVSKIKKHDDNISENLSDQLCYNVVKNNIQYVENTLHKYPDLVNKKNTEGLTPLHYACDRGYFDIVKILINANANINIPDIFGETPLHMAAYSEHLDIIEYLKEKGANMNIKNIDGLTVQEILNKQ